MKLRTTRVRRRGCIEIIPMIDVMFFLLATFMLASLALQNLHALRVDLPTGTATPIPAARPVTLTVTKEGGLAVGERATTLDALPALLAPLLGADHTIIVNADAGAPNGVVVQAMLAARGAGTQRFLFAIRRP